MRSVGSDIIVTVIFIDIFIGDIESSGGLGASDAT
jgi:hypothetical protein